MTQPPRDVDTLRDNDGEDDPVTAKLDELADQVDPTFGTLAGRRLIEGGHWTW